MEIISKGNSTLVQFEIFPTDDQAVLLEEWIQKYTASIKSGLDETKMEELNYAEMFPHFATWNISSRIKRDVWLIRNNVMSKFSEPVFRCNSRSYRLVRGTIWLRLRTKFIFIPTDGTWIPWNRQGSITFWKEREKWKVEILLWPKKKKERHH